MLDGWSIYPAHYVPFIIILTSVMKRKNNANMQEIRKHDYKYLKVTVEYTLLCFPLCFCSPLRPLPLAFF